MKSNSLLSLTMIAFTVLALVSFRLVQAETCRYEFNVPDNTGVRCGSNSSPELDYKLNRVESQLLIAQERTTSMHESLSKELTKLYTDNEALKFTTGQMESQLLQMNTAIKSVGYLNEEVHNLKNKLMNTSDSLADRFSNLQEKMMDVIEKVQIQSGNTNSLVTLQKQLVEQKSAIETQTSRIDQLAKDIQIVNESEKQIESVIAKIEKNTRDVTDIKEKLNMLVTEPALPDTVKRLNGTVNLLQTMLMNGLRGDSGKIRNLTTELNNLKEALNTLKNAANKTP